MRWLKIGVLALAVILGTLACTGQSASQEAAPVKTIMIAQYRKISPELAKEMMDSEEELIVVDVRTPDEYNQGHIAGALLIPNETISTTTAPAELGDKEALILVYCLSGVRSAQAARKLVSLGYTNVYDFGGIIDWPYEVVR
ncbi:MAG: rhodanese-like domain-containing protein [Sphaerochaetaceae bacterium]